MIWLSFLLPISESLSLTFLLAKPHDSDESLVLVVTEHIEAKESSVKPRIPKTPGGRVLPGVRHKFRIKTHLQLVWVSKSSFRHSQALHFQLLL